jgi:type VI secretion system Hcp family effector
MGTAGFLYLPGIQGDAHQEFYRGWIDITSFESDVYGTQDAVYTKAPNKPSGSIVIYKRVDNTSPRIGQACAEGRHFQQAVVTWYAQGLAWRMVMQNARVGSVATKAANATYPTDEVTLYFNQCYWEVVALDNMGNIGQVVKGSWSGK